MQTRRTQSQLYILELKWSPTSVVHNFVSVWILENVVPRAGLYSSCCLFVVFNAGHSQSKMAQVLAEVRIAMKNDKSFSHIRDR